jgi:hypothetical protein
VALARLFFESAQGKGAGGTRKKEEGKGRIAFAVLFLRMAHSWQNVQNRLAEGQMRNSQ